MDVDHLAGDAVRPGEDLGHQVALVGEADEDVVPRRPELLEEQWLVVLDPGVDPLRPLDGTSPSPRSTPTWRAPAPTACTA